MKYEERIRESQLSLHPHLWRELEEAGKADVENLLLDLEHAVSQGFFGLASEISDQLSTDYVEQLEAVPSRRVRLEVERMKRIAYMGYRLPALLACRRVLALIDRYRDGLPRGHAALWERTALGYESWTCESPSRLRELLAACESVHERLADQGVVLTEAQAFLAGLNGRLHTLQGEAEKACGAFEQGIEMLLDARCYRSWSHLQVLYAEHLVKLEDWQGALKAAWRFLDQAFRLQLRSHLLLRAVHLLLCAPKDLVDEAQRNQLRFRWEVLVHAMGISKSRTVFPLLDRAIEESKEVFGWDHFEFDLMAELSRWLKQLSPEGMELALAAYYRADGYQVVLFEPGTPALDVYAIRQFRDGTSHAVGVQVKHWQSRPLTIDRLPNEIDFEQVSRRIGEIPNGKLPNSLHWYCSSKISSPARQLLDTRAKACFGKSCQVVHTDLNGLVASLLLQPERLREIIFRVQVDGLYLGAP